MSLLKRSVLILHVDDEPFMTKTLKHFIEYVRAKQWPELDIRCMSFDNVIEALDWLQEGNVETVDLIISDVEMPGINGLEFHAVASKIFSKLPTWVFFTSSTEDGVTEYARLANVPITAKPLGIPQVTEMLSLVLD